MNTMFRKNRLKVIIAFAVALAFIMPVVAFANDKKSIGDTSEKVNMDGERAESPGLSDIRAAPSPLVDGVNVISDAPLCFGKRGDMFYAYRLYPKPYGPVSFESDNPKNMFLLKTSPIFMVGATWAMNTWYACQSNGALWTIDEVNGNMILIGDGGPAYLRGLSYDPTTKTMYGCSTLNLYTINMSNGNQTLIGPFNTGSPSFYGMYGIAFDSKGTLYGEDVGTDCLYSINTLTGTAKLIGPFGLDLYFLQDMEFGRNDVLYLAAWTSRCGQLYTCNVTNGALTLVGNFPKCSEIAALAIPYTPKIPQRPDGPSVGVPRVECTFSTITTNPEGEQVYYLWNWGNGTPGRWLGPSDSGVTVYANHNWTETGIYNIRVKAKNIYDAESDWSDPLTIYIIDVPVLEIGNITGGLFKVSAVIKNIGGVDDAFKVNWSITLDGGIILTGKETYGHILSIPAGDEVTVSSNPILGFGKTVVGVKAEIPWSSDTKEQDAFIFFIRILNA